MLLDKRHEFIRFILLIYQVLLVVIYLHIEYDGPVFDRCVLASRLRGRLRPFEKPST